MNKHGKKDRKSQCRKDIDVPKMAELLDKLTESYRTDLKDPKQLRAEFERIIERMATVGVELPVENDEQFEVRKAMLGRSLEELLSEDQKEYLKKLDDPEQRRRRFNKIVERLEREGLDGPPPPDEEFDAD